MTVPANMFVAGFIGSPPMNLLRGRVRAGHGHRGRPRGARAGRARLATCSSGVRPEALHPAVNGMPSLGFEVAVVEPLGDEVIVHGTVGAELAEVAPEESEAALLSGNGDRAEAVACLAPRDRPREGSVIQLGVEPDDGAPVRRGHRPGHPVSTGRDLDLLVLGDVNPDLVLSDASMEVAFGQAETLVDDAELTIGGSGAIMACAAARLGLRTALAGLVGDDQFGAFMLRAVSERGVDVSGVVVDPGVRTGLTVVLARPGDRAILTFPGAIAAMTAERVDPGCWRAPATSTCPRSTCRRRSRRGCPRCWARRAPAGRRRRWTPTGIRRAAGMAVCARC